MYICSTSLDGDANREVSHEQRQQGNSNGSGKEFTTRSCGSGDGGGGGGDGSGVTVRLLVAAHPTPSDVHPTRGSIAVLSRRTSKLA